MRFAHFAGTATLALSLALGSVQAQTPSAAGVVLKEKDVTEAALIDALTPETTVRTRSIKVRPNSPSPQAAAPEPAKESAGDAPGPYAGILAWFASGQVVNLSDETPFAEHETELARVTGLAEMVAGHAETREGQCRRCGHRSHHQGPDMECRAVCPES